MSLWLIKPKLQTWIETEKVKKQTRNSYVIIIIDLNHGCVNAGTKAFSFYQSKHFVFSSFSHFNAEFLLNHVQDLVGSAEHARSGCAKLEEIFSDRFSARNNNKKVHLMTVCYSLVRTLLLLTEQFAFLLIKNVKWLAESV